MNEKVSVIFVLIQADLRIEVVNFDSSTGFIEVRATDSEGKPTPITFATRAYLMQLMALEYLKHLAAKRKEREKDA